MEPKFKVGTAVKLKDDVQNGIKYPTCTYYSHHAKSGKKYTVSKYHENDKSFKLNETGYWVGEDALELWSEQEVKSEIDPQLFELVKAALSGVVSDSRHPYQAKVIAFNAISIAKETLRLLREEKNTETK